MTTNRAAMLELLLTADDAVAHEAPPVHIGYWETHDRIRRVKLKLDDALGFVFDIDDLIQDASFFVDLAIHKPVAGQKSSETVFALRFSNFGNLVAAWDYCHEDSKLPAQTIEKAIELVESEGFDYIDKAMLAEPYSGPDAYFVGQTWWDRFFDYI